MTTTKHPVGQLFFLMISLLGIAISAYLILVHYDQQNVPLVCSTKGFINCESVLNSQYAQVPGTTIPVSIPGLLWFLTAGILAFIAWNNKFKLKQLLLVEGIWSGLGIVTVFYLVYVELVKLHTLCAWCTALHVLILILLISSIFQFQETSSEDIEEKEKTEEMLPL